LTTFVLFVLHFNVKSIKFNWPTLNNINQVSNKNILRENDYLKSFIKKVEVKSKYATVAIYY